MKEIKLNLQVNKRLIKAKMSVKTNNKYYSALVGLN